MSAPRASRGRPEGQCNRLPARSAHERAAAFIAKQTAAGAKPDEIARAARNAWPDLTTSELVAANKAALDHRLAEVRAAAGEVERALRVGKATSPLASFGKR